MSNTLEFEMRVKGALASAQEIDKVTKGFKEAERSAEFASKEMAKVEVMMKRTGSAGKSLGGGVLQLSQTLDDLQYGIKGIVNNIPGLAMGLGLGAGVAGAAQLAFIAVNQLTDKITGYIKKQQQATQAAIGYRNALLDIRISSLTETKGLKDQLELLTEQGKTADEVERRKIQIRRESAVEVAELETRAKNADEQLQSLIKLAGDRARANGGPAFKDNVAVTLTPGERKRLDDARQARLAAMAQLGDTKEQLELRLKIVDLDEKNSKLTESTRKGASDRAKEERNAEAERLRLMKEQERQRLAEIAQIDKEQQDNESRRIKFNDENAIADRKALKERLDMDREIRLMADEMELADIEAKQTAIREGYAALYEDLGGIAIGGIGIMANAGNELIDGLIRGQEHAAEMFAVSIMSQAGQSLISSGVKLGGEAVVSAFTPGLQGLAAAQAAASAGLIAGGLALGAGSSALDHVTAGGTIGQALPDNKSRKDPGASPRSGGGGGSSGPVVLNLTYGVAGPLPEDTARLVARELKTNSKRSGR